MIRLEQMLHPSRIYIDLAGPDKASVLRALTERLVQAGAIPDGAAALDLLLQREALMTTAVKPGFAFPHAFSPLFACSFLTLGVVPAGVDFQAMDGRPVHYIFLLLGPPADHTIHLRVLARISRLTSHPDMQKILDRLSGPRELYDTLVELEHRLTVYSAVTP
jgi:mannitol/fructose-specific phosphotransferase system IIA component (Ntr-type)